MSDRLLGWLIADGQAHPAVIPATAVEVEQRVKELAVAIFQEAGLVRRREAADVRAPSRKLHDLLWKPWAGRLKPGARICIVPHGVLHYVPFQALHDGEAHLVERHDLFYAPSGSALVEIRRRRLPPNDSLAVLDPIKSDDPKSPFFTTETETLKARRADATVLMGKDATVAAFRAEAPKAGVLHVSSHGSFNRWLPLESGLQLANGMMCAKDVHAMRFERTHLVVMSACVSSVGDLAGGDEVTGLTRAFQVAGVPNVIGSLWPVDNAATTVLMTRFHERLSAGGDPAAALRAAQVSMIGEGRGVAHWAAFQVTGTGRAFDR